MQNLSRSTKFNFLTKIANDETLTTTEGNEFQYDTTLQYDTTHIDYT